MAVQFKISAKSEMLELPKFSKKCPLYFGITLPQVKLEFGSILMLFFKIQQGMGYVKILNFVKSPCSIIYIQYKIKSLPHPYR